MLRVDIVDTGNIEFTYLEIKDENVIFTHAIQIDINEFTVLQKMLEVYIFYITFIKSLHYHICMVGNI